MRALVVAVISIGCGKAASGEVTLTGSSPFQPVDCHRANGTLIFEGPAASPDGRTSTGVLTIATRPQARISYEPPGPVSAIRHIDPLRSCSTFDVAAESVVLECTTEAGEHLHGELALGSCR